jgi:anti-sigma factor RsiW
MSEERPLCRRVRENLSAHLDGELQGDARRLITDHLAECDACRRHFEQMKETWQLLDELEAPLVRRELSDEVWTKIHRERRAGPVGRLERLTGARGLVAGLAASAAAAVFLFGLYISSEPLGEVPTPTERECILYLDVLRELDTLEQMEMVRYVEQLGESIGGPETVAPDGEDDGV